MTACAAISTPPSKVTTWPSASWSAGRNRQCGGSVLRSVHVAAREEAEDLVQETYLRALRSLPTFRGDAPVLVWLLSIARRVCADHVRRRQRHRRLFERVARHAQSEVMSPEEPYEDLLAALGPDRRAAFVLTQMIGMSYEDAAAVPSTVLWVPSDHAWRVPRLSFARRRAPDRRLEPRASVRSGPASRRRCRDSHAVTDGGAELGVPAASRGGCGSYSMSSCVACAYSVPAIFSVSASAMSIPAETPAAVATLPANTTRSSVGMAP